MCLIVRADSEKHSFTQEVIKIKNKRTPEQLQQELDQKKHLKKYYENEIKIRKAQLSHLNRRERTHRLCSHGGMLEKFIERPDMLSDEQIMQLLSFAFHKNDVQALLRQMIKDAEEKSYGQSL